MTCTCCRNNKARNDRRWKICWSDNFFPCTISFVHPVFGVNCQCMRPFMPVCILLFSLVRTITNWVIYYSDFHDISRKRHTHKIVNVGFSYFFTELFKNRYCKQFCYVHSLHYSRGLKYLLSSVSLVPIAISPELFISVIVYIQRLPFALRFNHQRNDERTNTLSQ